MESKLEALETWFLATVPQKSAFWKVRRGASIVQTNLITEDAAESFSQLADLIYSIQENANTAVQLKVELIKNENDSKPYTYEITLPKKYGYNQPQSVGNVDNVLTGGGLGLIGQILNEKDKTFQKSLELQRLQLENEMLANANKNSVFQEIKSGIMELLESPAINTMIAGLMNRNTRAQIATLTGDTDEPQQAEQTTAEQDAPEATNETPMNANEKKAIDTILVQLKKHTSDPVKLIGDLADYMDRNPAQAAMALNMVGIQIEK